MSEEKKLKKLLVGGLEVYNIFKTQVDVIELSKLTITEIDNLL